jgi:hypothetical protein
VVKKIFTVSCLILFFSASLHAQEENEPIEEVSRENISLESEDEPLSPARQRIEMEIRTSTLSELAVWCRMLGLSESGTRAQLARRLRAHFDLPESSQDTENQKIIIIESAQTTEYFTIDVIDEDYARLKGNVSLSLQDGNTIHRISADEILFNRTRNILTARGQVLYERREDDSIETFRGENITVDLDNWASIFLDGSSTREMGGDGTAYLFSGTVISRSDQDVTVLSRATISNATNEEALWSVKATRLWLLPGSDFAIFNAILRVGEIPVLYIPFFYFPGDELIFHPVIGYRSREGGFVQTTTYMIGQPRADPAESSSVNRILGNSNDIEKEREGLFLRSTGRRLINPDAVSLKAIIDYYVNLGAYFALDLYVPKTGALNPLDFSLGLGFTRTISMAGGSYTPYAPGFDGSFDWNHSNFFSNSVPFRYRMRFQSSVTGQYGNLSWSFPYYSDPYVDRDFLNRSEKMNWMDMIQQGAAFDDDSTTISEIGFYQWQIISNFNSPVSAVTPYISRLSVSNLSTTMSFRTIQDREISLNNPFSPGRFFYAPDKYVIYNFSGTISGTPLTLGRPVTTPSIADEKIEDPLGGIGSPISPWINNEVPAVEPRPPDLLTPPVLTQTFNIPRTGNNIFSIDYQLSPTSSTEQQFMTMNWNTQDDIDWSEAHSILTSVGGNTTLNFRLSHTSGLYSNVITLSGSGTWRDYGYLNEDAFLDNNGVVDQNRIDQTRRLQYSQTNYSTFYAYQGTVRPLYENEIFGESNLQYNFRGTLVRSKRYAGTDGPELTPRWGSWVKEERIGDKDILGLTSHRLATNMAANVMDFNQNISVSADLPPLDGLIITNATFRFWISETNVRFNMEKEEPLDESGQWTLKPIHITEILRFRNIGSFTYYMVIDPEENNEVTTITTSLLLWNFRASYTAEKMTKSTFVLPGGWERYGEPTLLPKELSLSYVASTSNRQLIRNRLNLSFNVNTSLRFDLQQHTNSNFLFTTGMLLNVPGFMDLRLSATARNSIIWRYFKNVPGMEDLTFMYPDGPQNNVFSDLLDSFNFSDDAKRRRSGFKIQRFNFSILHYLGDWQADLGISMYPYQDLSMPNQNFRIAADISFLVKWIPIPEIKTDIAYDSRDDRWISR